MLCSKGCSLSALEILNRAMTVDKIIHQTLVAIINNQNVRGKHSSGAGELYTLNLLRQWRQGAVGQRCRSWIPMGLGWYSGIIPDLPVPQDLRTLFTHPLFLSFSGWEIQTGTGLGAYF